MTVSLTNGIGETAGTALATVKPLRVSGNVWYVNSATGTDAVSPAGKNREKPLATLAQAVTNAADNDIICMMDGHTETITSSITLSKRLCVIGSGSSAGVPTVVLTPNLGANARMFIISIGGVELRGFKIAQSSQANTGARVDISQFNVRLIDMYIECGANDTGPAVKLNSGGDSCFLKNTTIISMATSRASQPESAVKIGAAVSDLYLEGLVLSAGSVGFSNPYAFDASAAAITRLRGESVSLLLGADMTLNASTVGWLNTSTVTGGSREDW